MTQKDDYNLEEKIKISFKDMPYYVMPRYRTHYIDHDYEKFSLQILKNNLNADKIFLDIGAHYGAYSLYAAKAAGSKVIAIEPVSENFDLLNQNVKTNHLEKLITTHNYAISDANGEAEFNIPWASDSAGFYEHPNAETIRKQKVQVRKIDDLVGKSRVDVIKIDTEGHEVSVLQGMAKTLKNNPQAKLIIELNPECLKRAGKSVEELLATIAGHDKEIYIVNEDTFTLIRLSDQLENWRNYVKEYANLYCVPRTKAHQYLLFVAHSSRLDGAERALADQVCALRDKGWLSHVVLPRPGPLQDLLVEKGIGNSIVDGYSFWVDHTKDNPKAEQELINYLNVKASASIAGIAAHIKPTAVINNTIVNPWGYAAARSVGLPLFWMIHEFGDIDHDMAFLHDINIIRRFVVKESDLVFACSDAVRKSLKTSDGLLNAKVHTTYNMMDQAAIFERSKERIKNPFSDSNEVLKLCIVGTIKEKKGQILAIQAVHALKEQRTKAELIIIGEGPKPYVTKLKRLVKELGLGEQVQFLGTIANPYPYMRSASAVLVCSVNEAFGRVAAEAMMLDVPVVGSNAGGLTELVQDGKTGLLFKPLDVNDLVRQLKRLKQLPLDTITATAHRTIVRLLDVDRNIDTMMKLISGHKTDPQALAYGKILNEEWVAAVAMMSAKFGEIEARRIERDQITDQLKAENHALKSINSTLQKNLKDVINSRSWKLTKPLRGSKYIVKKLKKKVT